MNLFRIPSLIMSALIPAAAPAQEVSLPVCGQATYYHSRFIGRIMSNGERYDPQRLTMATSAFPLGSLVSVEYTSRGGSHRRVVVRVTDRMATKNPHAFDLSFSAFRKLENHKAGRIDVRCYLLR